MKENDGWDYLTVIRIKTSIQSGQISIIPRPELKGFWGDSLTKPPFKVTSAEVVTICRVSFCGSPTLPKPNQWGNP